MLCGHAESRTVAFRVQNVRKHAVLDPHLKVFLVGPPSNPRTASGEMPTFRRLVPRLPEAFDLLELPQVVAVRIPADMENFSLRDAGEWFVHLSFTATDPATGSVFEIRKLWSLHSHLQLDADFATVRVSNPVLPLTPAPLSTTISENSDSMLRELPEWFTHGMSVDLNRFHMCVPSSSTPEWVIDSSSGCVPQADFELRVAQ
eukprot:CAMPEP_0178379352 /NCGR_PEP_ID=MMETSP0689_2-20121128/4898_1 /TAXON_ID=160604 /ORGANISM="Amphidinium massartii, Strain CS-259" /LENGTH=202 /DNA_ID=CAMNT_0019999451 /DNA_START=475 /DNA_END=1083 /DNA_ORIENTATION=-